MQKVKVQVTLQVEVQVPDDVDARLHIEDWTCPGTGQVGAAIYAAIKDSDERSGVCWACNFRGKNRILKIART